MPKRTSLARFTALLAVLLLVPALENARAQAPDSNSPSAQLETLMHGAGHTRSISQVALSPDGKRVAWNEMRQLFVAPLNDLSKPLRVTAATSANKHCGDDAPIWSPDSSALAFLSDCAGDDGQADLYLSRLDSKPPARLSALNGYVHEPAFSLDGSKIAFLYVEGATRPAGALAAMKPPSGVIGEDGIEVQRVAAVAANGTERSRPDFITPANLHVYEFDWSPDSKQLAYIAAEPPGENNWWVAKLYLQSLVDPAPDYWTSDSSNSMPGEGALADTLNTSGTVTLRLHSNPAVILDPATVEGPLRGLQIAVPRWSPDGKSIAFIGGLMSDQGSTGGDVYVIPSAGAQNAMNLTAGRNESAAWISWKAQGEIDYAALAGGSSQLRTLVLDSPTSMAVRNNVVDFEFPASIGDGRMEMSLSHEGNAFAFIKSSFSDPPEIFVERREGCLTCKSLSASLTQLTHLNDGAKPFWGETKSIEWKNDGFSIQGWLMLPRDYNPHKEYPMIVDVHGGPAAAVVSRWSARGSLSAAAFSALGYFVLMPNPRGSFGEGEAFVQANRKDFGYGDLRDILTGVDTVIQTYPVDPKRVGLTGWSYGGFMSMFAVTQTHRFRAAVAGAGISDWLSYYGENSIDEWMIPYFGASVYDDPAVYAKMSAINYIKNVTTPTLAVVGDRDGECPAPQSFEFWHALHDLHVPAELVVYPNEGHGFVNPDHRRDVLDRAVNWFAKYMPAE
jgi:dipeptidyl aminopeptidase/acylaminoacyl peptidase